MSDVESRLAKVEAELSIRNVIARYGLAADSGDIDAALKCHTTDAIYIVSNPNAGRGRKAEADLELRGHAAISEMLSSERHQSLLPSCAHTVGPLVVELDGRRAKVLGYSRIYNIADGHTKLMRVAFNQWDMFCKNNIWKIARRESRVMGEDAAQALIRTFLNQ